ncbi:molybdopterin-dependent oxidoreductase [Marinilongibacter aquaticus]|uniref:xanthine dehydrogenase family protein molybdopterin-binding subunit n=1 Tax=Marinilongibacter aquaticus TaxID=2975157 RepID=UPI0021BD1FA6|nr:molybdopterin cofactor-binding domain-containing protein [Marinilongibacter aquaticus]UBM60217.1 molybdopterin-dependent oxidoreductase [Marinilongibacter aquaticus]
MKKKQNRRSFLKVSALGSGGMLLSVSWLSSFRAADKEELLNAQADWQEISGYIRIKPDNSIQILAPNPEFGNNVLTSLPMIVAEELDADWKMVEVEQAPFDAAVYGGKGARQFTGGSRSVMMWWKPLREAGAAGRQMLINAAAKSWSVPASEIKTEKGILFHGNKRATYGEMAAKAAQEAIPENISLKELADFDIVRTSKKNVRGKDIVTGKPMFGVDYKAEGMLIAMLQHPPAFGMKLKSFDASRVLKMPGIKDVFSIEVFPEGYERGGFDTRTFNELVAVVGNSTWEVMQARKKLKVEWEKAAEKIEVVQGWGGKSEERIPAGLPSSDAQYKEMEKYAKEKAVVLRKDGDPEAAFARAAKVLERTYTAPFLAHNTMEPMNFFADVSNGKAFMAGPLQAPEMAEATVSKRLGIPVENIDIHMTRMGGGFGRRAYAHYLVEAALVSQKAKAPVKLMYSREDDMTYGIYRPMYTALYRAAIDEKNNLIGFHVKGGGIPEHPIAANRFPAGAVDNYLAEGWQIPSNITIGAFRAPRSNFNAAAEQSFLDELAETLGKDPIDFRLELLERAKSNPVGENNDYDVDRYAGVIKLVKEKSAWGSPENEGKKRGVAAYFCHASYAAHVVDMVEKDGQPYVEKVTTAMDCGIVINPDAAKNMVEGAVVDGIGNSLYGRLSHSDGRAEQNNFDTYRIIRNREAPKVIDVHFVENDIDPTGLGEPPFPPVFGAVANALYQKTGRRQYNQPFQTELPNS